MNRSLRDSWQEAWQSAIELTVDSLHHADLEERCDRSGARWLPVEGAVELALMDRVYRVLPPAFEVVGATDVEAVPLTTRILLLHYLHTASGAPLTGEWISFAQVPGGERYLQNFRARSVDRLVRAFAGRETALVEAAVDMGGKAAALGDVSVQIPVLPRVPVTMVLWFGDEEFSPAGNLLFDASVTGYLPVEDMVVLAGMTVSRLCR